MHRLWEAVGVCVHERKVREHVEMRESGKRDGASEHGHGHGQRRHKRVRRPGIEPGASRWQRDILPLNQRRLLRPHYPQHKQQPPKNTNTKTTHTRTHNTRTTHKQPTQTNNNKHHLHIAHKLHNNNTKQTTIYAPFSLLSPLAALHLVPCALLSDRCHTLCCFRPTIHAPRPTLHTPRRSIFDRSHRNLAAPQLPIFLVP